MQALFKQIIKSVLGRLEFEIQRKPEKQTSPLVGRMFTIRTSMEQVLDHFVAMDFSPATVFDVGVAEGTPALYTRFSDAKHILIEPLKEFEPSLKGICSLYNAEYVLAAAGDRPGMMEIGVSDNLIASSLLRSYGEKRKIPVVTLDNVCKERRLNGPYVVKIDVQGAELHVLDGTNTVLKDTELVILEVSFYRTSAAHPDFYDVINYMMKRGFVVYEIFGGHNRPLDGARAQADIAFVKKEGRFRTSNAWGTPEQIAEFHRLTMIKDKSRKM